ncbi:MAG TPA: hypothetical protein VME63_04340 [Dyella sp.]|uniref:hypothetical protein n=1 Tax=Dyella sp. TaxID=1869338 RepID=UPI002B9F1F91|nr:hypothetical protein [Dyella sp.]HTV84608.1 hypothetical protein [Dyella sp.]
MEADKNNKLSLGGVIIFAVIWAVLLGYRFVSPSAREGREFLEHLPLADIRYVRIDPTSDHSLIHGSLIVRDRAEIKALLTPMTGMWHVVPNHPVTTWSVIITIATDHKEFGGVITSTSNQGVLFTYRSSGTLHWVYQQYGMKDPAAAIRSVNRPENLETSISPTEK